MIATRTTPLAHHDERAPRRGVIGFLLLGGIEWTDARPWFGFVGIAITGILGAIAKQVLL